jgi:hypothetical protein
MANRPGNRLSLGSSQILVRLSRDHHRPMTLMPDLFIQRVMSKLDSSALTITIVDVSCVS